MSASFRQGLVLLICAAMSALGCDDGTTPLSGEEEGTREKQQLALPGEPCTLDTECDDGNECTDDFCNVDVCDVVNNSDPCNADSDVCTVDDMCVAGACVAGTADDCDDANPCTDDSCDPILGCANDNDNNNTCSDDGNACTTVHFCLNGTCEGNTPPTCDDGNDCTDDFCDSGLGCQFVNDDTNTCDDSDLCTENDVCSAGACGGAPKVCDTDPDDCTIVSCNSSNGMCQSTNVSNGVACDDDDACTSNEACQAGTCEGGAAVVCDDGNDCTSNACDSASGCVFTDISAACDDGDACTTDSCQMVGGCQNVDISATCNDGDACTADSCNSASGCINVDISASCDDGLQCTADSCNPASGCVNDAAAMDAQPCDDGSACNDNEACAAGVCTGGAARVCDDGNQCTTNTCNPASGCQFLNDMDGDPCSDGIACTENNTCTSLGTCGPGTANHSACPDDECAEGICTLGVGCTLAPEFLKDTTCRDVQGSCDQAETCDGIDPKCPADVFLNSSTVCVAATCADGTQTDEVRCLGTEATCQAATTTPCNGFACDGGTPSVCLGACTVDADCLPTHYCDDLGGCQAKLNPGGQCTQDSQCDTAAGDSCVDGRCCDSPCTGQCQACDVPGSLGQCVPVPEGEAPHPGGAIGATRSQCTTDGSSCGGSCDGVNVSACAFPAAGSECGPPSCNSSTNQAVETSVCNGLGACNAPAPASCDPFVCAGDACRTTCTQDSHCDGNLQCVAGACVDTFSTGSDCTVGSQCASGNCIDGVCCDSACTGQCEACNVAGERGTCTAVSGDPVGSRPSCGGSGQCAGTCDGSNRTACAFPENQVRCRDAACTDGVATLSSFCNGGGICPGAQTVACEDGCDGVLCENPQCALNDDCDGDNICRAGVCVPPDENAAACSADADCASGHCVDGVCCDSVCAGQCEACDVSGSVGTCSAVPAGSSPHGGRQACTSDGSICGGSCDGSTTDTCTYPTSGECRSGSCDDGVAILSATCDGAGTCPLLQEQDCGTVSCEPADAECDGACAGDPSACTTDEYCSAGICVTLRDDGTTCAADSQCESGHCVDGICCNTECTDQCGACNVPGSLGVCSPVEGAPVGARTACEGSGTCAATCNGEDVRSCSFPGTEMRCGEATCESGVERPAPVCGGDGRCVPGVAVSCPTLLCNGSECADSCEEDDECQGELVCIEGACIEDPFIDAVDKGSCGCRMPGDRPPARPANALFLLLPLALIILRRKRSA